MLQQPAADPKSALLWRYRHLRQLVNTIAHRYQSHAANSLMAEIGHEHIAALLEDLVLGVAQGFAIRLLQGEVTGDPLFIQRPEGGRVFSRLQWPDLYLRKTHRMLRAVRLHLVPIHFSHPLIAVSALTIDYVQYLVLRY